MEGTKIKTVGTQTANNGGERNSENCELRIVIVCDSSRYALAALIPHLYCRTHTINSGPGLLVNTNVLMARSRYAGWLGLLLPGLTEILDDACPRAHTRNNGRPEWHTIPHPNTPSGYLEIS